MFHANSIAFRKVSEYNKLSIYLEKLEPVLNELIRDGLFISDDIKERALREAGEL